jgi:hypothetical protein
MCVATAFSLHFQFFQNFVPVICNTETKSMPKAQPIICPVIIQGMLPIGVRSIVKDKPSIVGAVWDYKRRIIFTPEMRPRLPRGHHWSSTHPITSLVTTDFHCFRNTMNMNASSSPATGVYQPTGTRRTM